MNGVTRAAWTMAMAGLLGCTASANVDVNEPQQPPPPPPPVATPAPPPAPPPSFGPTITISNRIEFETDSPVLLPQSLPILNEVVNVLRNNPGIELVEIGGHTDSTGSSDRNRVLSQERADSVRVYLVSQGIAFERLRTMGYGDRVPVATNDTPEGRERNRRVEFRIVKQH